MGAYSFIVFNLVATATITAVLSFRYGNWKKQNIVVTLVHCLSWWLPALILTTLPVDIATAFYTNCTSSPLANPESGVQPLTAPLSEQQPKPQAKLCRAPWLYADSRVLLIFWHTVYWSSQFLTWLVIPIMRSFSTAGDFTTLTKLRTALIDNVLYYASYLTIFIIALVYLLVKRAIKLEFGYLKVLIITAANTWGLFLVILFLGYGLVAVPRTLWTAGNPLASLRRAYFTLSKRNMELADEEDKLGELIEKVKQLKTGLPLNHPLQRHLLVVVKQAQQTSESPGSLSHSAGHPRVDLSATSQVHFSDPAGLSLKQLTRLHRSIKSTQHRRNRAEALYWDAVGQAIWIEDLNTFRSKRRILAFAQEHSGRLVRYISFHVPWLGSVLLRTQAYWYCYARLWLIRLLAIALAVTSLLMVWSECTFFVRSPTLSLVAGLVKAQARRDDYFLLELFSFLTLGYLSLAVFYSVFRLRLFNYYRLVGSHHTDENSLLFCGALLCRLTPSLCLNFLGLAHLDSHISRTTLSVPINLMNPVDSLTANNKDVHDAQLTSISETRRSAVPVLHHNLETTYTRFMGHLDVIPFIASGFNIYFPILVVLLCVLTLVRFGDRVLHHLGVPQLLDEWIETDNMAADSPNSLVEDAVQDGRLLLRKERMVLSRKERSSSSGDPLRTFSPTAPKYSRRSQAEDRIHLLESSDYVDRELLPNMRSPARLTRGTDVAGREPVIAVPNYEDEDETDLLPPMRYSDSNPMLQFPVGSSRLVEYSEEEIKRQFSLGAH